MNGFVPFVSSWLSMTKLDLNTLIDLEAQLQKDADAPIEELDARDEPIAGRIDANKLDGRALYLAWWDELRKQTYGERPTPGQHFGQWRDMAGAALGFFGLVFGFAAMWGYLAAVTSAGYPVNTVRLWAVFVGLQILLVLAWLLLIVVSRGRKTARLPLLGGLLGLLRAVQSLLPRFAQMLGGEAGARFGRLKHHYAKLSLWLISRLTQTFALAFNVGVLIGFVAAGYVSDPSFGWRSTLLEAQQVDAAARAIVWFYPDAAPTAQQVEATRFSSLDVRFVEGAEQMDGAEWSAWWLFVLASLLAYGVLPRVVTWGLSVWGVRRSLRRVKLDHEDFQLLRERLKRPGLAQRIADAEASGSDETIEGGDNFVVLRWSGVPGGDEAVKTQVRQRLGVNVQAIHRVGALDVNADEAAIQQAKTSGGGGGADVAVVVEGWEPPVGDYLDLLAKLRQAIGPNRQIVVLVAGADDQPPSPQALALWRSALHKLSDPRLRTAGLVRGEDRR